MITKVSKINSKDPTIQTKDHNHQVYKTKILFFHKNQELQTHTLQAESQNHIFYKPNDTTTYFTSQTTQPQRVLRIDKRKKKENATKIVYEVLCMSE